MSSGDNLGVAGVILAFFAIAAPYLWRNQKWIGWAAIIFAAVSIAGWAFLAFGSFLGIVAAELILFAIAAILLWLLSKSKGNGTPMLEATASNADYPPGTRLGNLQWSPRFTDLRFIIRNPTGADLEDIDLVLLPDVAIAAADQITQLPDVSCSLASDVQFTPESIDGVTGKRTRLPLVPIASSEGCQLRCKKLPSKQRLELVLAAVVMADYNSDPAKAQKPSSEFDRIFVMKVDGHKEKREWSIWFGYGRDSSGTIEEVYSPQRPIPRAIQVEGTYKIKADRKEVSQRLQVHDFVDEFLPKIREQIQRGVQ